MRISATNGGGTTNSALKEFTTDPVPPTDVFTAFVAPRTDMTVRLNGRVNPQGANATYPLTYRFEYSKDGGATWIALPDREYSGKAREQILLAEELTGLTPNTTYSYGFSAESDAGPASPQGAVKAFTTRTTSEMVTPQRGVELVNNPDKGNQHVFMPEPRMNDSLMSQDGNLALWGTAGGAPGGYNGTFTAFLAERTADGWRSRSIPPPAAQQVGGGNLLYALQAITPDFSQFVFDVKQSALVGSKEATRVRLDPYQNESVLRAYSWAGFTELPGRPELSVDGSHVLAIDKGDGGQLEDIGDGTSEVVSLMPDGTPSSCELEQGPSFVGGIGAHLPIAADVEWRPGYHMIDRGDASLVYFEAKPNGECGAPWGLYLRDRDAEQTTLIDPGAEGRNVSFVRATPNGEHGYFVTLSQLDPADANSGADLYRWDRGSGESACLTCVVPDARVEDGLDRNGEVLISDDFSHIYFESDRQLVAGLGDPAGNNIYVLSGGQLGFVTESFANDHVLKNGNPQLSRDGNVLVWERQDAANTSDAVEGGNQLYLYDDRDDSVECVSCVHGAVTTYKVASRHFLSADGSTVAFETRAALVPRDVNGRWDVYEWRNGARGLITDGVTEFPGTDQLQQADPLPQGIDADGSNVFFSVAQPGLTGFEEDGFANLYDARIGGGFEPPPPPSHCDGDSCQGPLLGAPVPGSTSSATYSGRGNLAPRARHRRKRCAKKHGKARRRCIRRHKRRKARAHHSVRRVK